jgi:hypothetical protein
MAQFSVPIKRTVLEVWLVDARSATDAGAKAMLRMANGEKPDDVRNVTATIMSAHRVLDDTEVALTLDSDSSPEGT